MPELPEVETTRRGIERAARGLRISEFRIYDHRLRWPIDRSLPQQLADQQIVEVERRAKYLLLRLTKGTLILHLGMSGSLRLLPGQTERISHDQFDLLLDSGHTLRFNDPRRFGSLHYTIEDPAAHRLLRSLAPEPFDVAFNADYLFRLTRRRSAAIKQVLMNGRLVTGVGNIYASEALFRARVSPRRAARKLTRAECARIVRAVRAALQAAIRAGGTTLRDYVGTDGNPGYFRQKLYVYERDGKACRRCATLVRKITQGQRSTYFCPQCQH
ncbi:MAG TPA: bifunctional DNA-formamidopyrimidine glycosylase/DNA-(apurinic or apyrimidinic site) lyase [Steroidobacteraceae bacterium]|jgi:formamidopyrimidine-DNA glycosylase|nr:bifunctional DNA-formamidopyrimidine glycosylase/DNA-(apurinic or apyrimidinic site) lyase [Steroidobacteraceae bacterium]